VANVVAAVGVLVAETWASAGNVQGTIDPLASPPVRMADGGTSLRASERMMERRLRRRGRFENEPAVSWDGSGSYQFFRPRLR